MTYVEAYKNWVKSMPITGYCCNQPHYKNIAVHSKDPQGNPYTIYKMVPIDDARVCPRERAWRKYIQVRDGK